MSILAWIVVGIIAGWLARMAIPGAGPAGLLGDLVLGVVGAIVGGWVFNAFGYPGATGASVAGTIVLSPVGLLAGALVGGGDIQVPAGAEVTQATKTAATVRST